jgi:photosystem II stability/assembly factor-like uncharacterized protein
MRKALLLLLFLFTTQLQVFAQTCNLKITSSVAKPCEGQTVNFTSSGISTNATLRWRKNSVDIDAAIAANYSSNQVGNYELRSTSEIWNFQNFPIKNFECTNIFFLNTNKGWLVGGGRTSDRILGTNDGGTTWKVKGTSDLSTSFITSINVGSGQNGCAVGYNNNVWTTTDAGENWSFEEIVNGSDAYDLVSVKFSDDRTVWVVGRQYDKIKGGKMSGVLLKSIDGGKKWEKKDLNVSNILNSIFFVDSKIGWISGEDGILLKTIDGGQNWLSIKNISGNLENIFFLNKDLGWVVSKRQIGTSQKDAVFKTNDGGNTWKQVNGVFFESPSLIKPSINFANDKLGLICASYFDFMYKTIDGGETWSAYKIPTKDAVYNNAIYLSPQRVIAISDYNGSLISKYEFLDCTSNTITINPKPAAPTVAWSNTDAKLTATSSSAGTLAWLKGTDEIKNITTATYQPTSSGSYSVRVTDGNGCSEISKAVEVTILASDNPLNESAVSVYPNPSSNGIFRVAYTRFSNEMEATMQVIGLDGLPLNSQKMVRQNNTFEGEINASNLATGIYLLQVVSGEQKAVIKISIAK